MQQEQETKYPEGNIVDTIIRSFVCVTAPSKCFLTFVYFSVLRLFRAHRSSPQRDGGKMFILTVSHRLKLLLLKSSIVYSAAEVKEQVMPDSNAVLDVR